MALTTVRCYARVSTEEQADEGFSIPAQRAALVKYAEVQGWEVAEVYLEEGRSAKDLDRPQLARLRADLRPGEIVLVYRLDRLTRSVLDLHTLLQEWEKLKIGFRSATEVYDTTTAMGRLFITLVAAMAQWERENLAERVKFGMTEMVKQGKWYGGPVPFGYLYDQVAGHLVPDPETAELVRQIYRWYAAGRGTRAIAIEMNQSGRLTSQGNQWSATTVTTILFDQQLVYQGHTHWNKKGKGDALVVNNTHEPIVPAELIDAVNQVRASHAGRHPREIASTFPLTGIIRCAICGSRVNGKTQPRYDKRTGVRRWSTRGYWCQERKVRNACTLPTIPERQVDAAVLAECRRWSDPTRLRDLVAESSAADPHEDEREALTRELHLLARRIRRWWDDYEAGDVPAKIANERTAALATREAEIRRRLAEILPVAAAYSVDQVSQLLRDLPWHWEHATVEEKKQLAAEIFEEILLYPDGDVDVKLKPLRM